MSSNHLRRPYVNEALFWPKVNKTETCWFWTAGVDEKGYGRFAVRGKNGSARAHRIAYELIRGPIPEGLGLDHLCRTRSCVNPDHLEAVTQRVNTHRGMGPGGLNHRKTHCIRGHLLDGVRKQGGRYCLTCHRTATRIAKLRIREARRGIES